MANFLVGCDIGTSGAKAVVMAENGVVMGSHFVEYPLLTASATDGCLSGTIAEQDPAWYWNGACETIGRSILAARIDPKEIRAVCVSALSPACILIDKNHHPLQNAHIWMDRRATAECDWIRRTIGEDRVFALSANGIDPFYAATKLMWERNHRPELYQHAFKLQTASDYVCMKLCDRAVTDYSNASLIGIAFDIVHRRWDEGLIEELGLDPAKFPEPFPCDAVIGEVTREAARQTGLAPGTPVVAGTVDTNASCLAGGAVDAGATQFVMGTSGSLTVVHDTPSFTRRMISVVHAADSKTKYTTVAALVSCGALIRYFRDHFGQMEQIVADAAGTDAYAVLNEEAERVSPGSDGLIALPYFMGERTPIWDPHARGVLFGMTLQHGRGHLVRALMEGVAYGLLENFELMRASGLNMTLPLVLSEGGASSRLWRQIIADMLDVECVYMPTSKGAPVGDAVIAGVGVGVYKDYSILKDWLELGERTLPLADNHARYRRLYAIYRDLYPALKNQFAQLQARHGEQNAQHA